MHPVETRPRPGQRLPLMVLVTRAPELVVVEGASGWSETRDRLRALAPQLFRRR